MHRRPWRRYKSKSSIRHDDDEPGTCVYIDQLVSKQPGLIPRIEGTHTRDQITGATVFKYHASDLGYVHLHTSATTEETIAGKVAFEKIANSYGVRIKSYCADNGHFADKGFKDDFSQCNQSITFGGVESHHQNGIIERFIQTLTEGSRINLLHAKRYWPETISAILWPFALKNIETRLNELGLGSDLQAPLKRFSNQKLKIDPSQWHTFGFPCYALDSWLQSGLGTTPKWEPRDRLGIYVGHSPFHAGSVALVLNPKTLHVSPQFHAVFDDNFSTVPFMRNNEVPPNWKELVKNSSQLATDMNFDAAKMWYSDVLKDPADIEENEKDYSLVTAPSNKRKAKARK